MPLFSFFTRIEKSGGEYKWTANFQFSRSFPTNGKLQIEVEGTKYKCNRLIVYNCMVYICILPIYPIQM